MGVFLVLIIITYGLYNIRKNQKAALKIQRTILENQRIFLELKYDSEHPAHKQFSNPAVFGEIIKCSQNGYEKLPDNYKFAIGALIRRLEFTHKHKDLFFANDEEWKRMGENDILDVMSIPAVRQHWQRHNRWYTKNFQDYLNNLLGEFGPDDGPGGE